MEKSRLSIWLSVIKALMSSGKGVFVKRRRSRIWNWFTIDQMEANDVRFMREMRIIASMLRPDAALVLELIV